MKKKYIFPLFILLFGILFFSTQFSSNFQSSELSFSQIPDDFVYDGCSLFPDGDYADCCKDHDDDYFFGGSWQERLRSDTGLMSCVMEKGRGFHTLLGPLMWTGVRIGGAPIWPTSYRWGFGRDRY